jgi:hypothetical protein
MDTSQVRLHHHLHGVARCGPFVALITCAPGVDLQYKREKQRVAQRLRVYNTLSVPASLERALMWGTVLCLDSFIFIFTLLPL